ncbi:MAG TPA: sensor domain-containing diguanylate cyclase [Afifellaceae bacterium]|nr:sensor domain-containing diguanylate cyclase [Afifellaceae bacterium]
MDETPRDVAFCDHTIRNPEPMVVEDARLDERFADNPFVTGEPGIRFYAGAPLHTRDGQNIGTLCTIDLKPRSINESQLAALSDLARLVVDEMELRLLATTDSLTGVMARRALIEAARRDLAQAKRLNSDLGCVVLDIDHFKVINDCLGHAAGDRVLKQIVEVCEHSLRSSDYVGRIGGEEFAIILRNTNEDAAVSLAERMRAKIEALAIEYAGKRIPVTASFGVADLRPVIGSLEELLKEADTALYVAKANGRNQTVRSSEVEQAVNAA